MAKLFANKFNLDQLPDPKKPKQDIQQGSTTVNRTAEENFITNPKLDIKPIKQGDRTTNPDLMIKAVDQGSRITDPQLEINPIIAGDRTTNPNISVEPTQPIDINTQRLNARFRDIDSQKNAMSTSDEILESQGVRKSSAEQYVSRTRVEPFGDKPVNQGSTNIKLPAEIEGKTSPVYVKRVDDTTLITDPKTEVLRVDQGSMITDPKTKVVKIEPGDRIVNPDTPIKLVNSNERIVNPNIEIQRVKEGDRIIDPKIPIKLVDQNEFIVNPNTIVNKIVEGDRIVNPNTVIKKTVDGELITDPKIIISKVKDGDRIVDPKIKIVRVTADELIVNPNIQPQQTKPVTQPTIPLYGGIGVTKLFPRQISLKDRLQQANLGTTRHLPEYILSDDNTGYITIKNPKVIEKVTNVRIQRVGYENTILKQGGVEEIVRGLVSFINPIKYGDKKVNQGSITIKNNIKQLEKPSPIQIKKVSTRSLVTDPRTIIKKVESGDRTTDPNIKVIKVEQGELVVDPKIQVSYVDQGDQTTNPNIQIVPIDQGELITVPEIKVKKLVQGDKVTDPKTEIKEVKPGERTVDPKTKVSLVEPGERTVDPQTKVSIVKPGDRTTDPKTEIVPVEPGERTIDPKTKIQRVLQGSRTYIPYVPIFPFIETDDKVFYAQEPIIFENNFDIFPSDGLVPLTGEITPSQPTPGTVFPGDTTQQGSAQPVFVSSVGITYTNQYNTQYKYNVDDTTSYLKNAADRNGNNPLLTKVYDIASNTVVENKEVAFPPAINGDYTLPGGYRTLNYTQIQRRGSNNDRRNLDFTYEEGGGNLAPWRQRLGMPDKGADTINQAVNSTARDLVTVKLQSGRDGSILQFRSYIKAFSDNYSAQYTDINYVGRPDTLKVFKGTTRQISLGFVVPALSADELDIIYQKLNKLVQVTSMGAPKDDYMQGAFMFITVGGWCKKTPVVVNSLKFETNPSEYTWDIVHEVPQIVDVSMDCAALADNTGLSPFLSTGTYISYGA